MPDHTHSDKENSRSSFTSHHDEKRGGRGLPAVHPYGLAPVQPKREKHWLVQMQEGKQRRSLPAVPVLQNKPVQKKELDEEELPVQQKSVVQRQAEADDLEEELPLQGKFEPADPIQQQEAPVQKKPNDTGLPDNLKEGVENLSGYSMNDVKVHYNSDKPAQLQALAYAQGTDIHVGPGQEQHLPHEAWHVVQQKQGRVQPTMQMKGGIAVNDDKGLEQEADVMGAEAFKAFSLPTTSLVTQAKQKNFKAIVQPNAKSSIYQFGNNSVKASKEQTEPTGLTLEGIHKFNAECDEAFRAHIQKVLTNVKDCQLSVYAAGSYGRNEAIKGSDLDYFVVAYDNTEETENAVKLLRDETGKEITVNNELANNSTMRLEYEEMPKRANSMLKRGLLIAGRRIYSVSNEERPESQVQKISREDLDVILEQIKNGIDGEGTEKVLYQAIAKLAVAIGEAKGYGTINPIQIFEFLQLEDAHLNTYKSMLTSGRSSETNPKKSKDKNRLYTRLKELAKNAY